MILMRTTTCCAKYGVDLSMLRRNVLVVGVVVLVVAGFVVSVFASVLFRKQNDKMKGGGVAREE